MTFKTSPAYTCTADSVLALNANRFDIIAFTSISTSRRIMLVLSCCQIKGCNVSLKFKKKKRWNYTQGACKVVTLEMGTFSVVLIESWELIHTVKAFECRQLFPFFFLFENNYLTGCLMYCKWVHSDPSNMWSYNLKECRGMTVKMWTCVCEMFSEINSCQCVFRDKGNFWTTYCIVFLNKWRVM